ncbi:carboxylate--amine ligase [Sphingomonas lacunae]|uniref:Carboxylate--amine ligase n=1 Tax=Sphingomonas lacunae TaxID=2698828 RepID=A0A6M4AVJ9_9SPHN|nr:carboxylate--amine ligase [Sphingomonas lacunae]QJQ33143.1 carboxylate--amine ligase [Sphingomonas lacunae]
MTDLPLAIVLGVDTPIGLTVLRELGEHDVPVHGIGRSSHALGRFSRYCTSFSVRPSDVPLDQWLPELIQQTGAAILFAISEGDLLALADLPERVNGCLICTPRRDRLERVLDKRQTLELAAALGMDVPASWQPVAGDDFAARSQALPYPVVLKWADPPAVIPALDTHALPFEKAEFAMDAPALLAALERYRPMGLWPMVQSYCPGEGLGHMLLMHQGQAKLRFQHRRLHEWPPEGGVSTLCTAEPAQQHHEQMERSQALLRALDWQGPAMVEYRHDAATGRYWLMEVNGRFWGSLPLAWHCGASFAWTSYHLALFGVSPAQADNHPKMRRARYMIPETRRLLRIVRPASHIRDPQFRRKPMADLATWLFGFFDPAMRYYVFTLRDPGPFLADCTHVIRKAAQSLVRRRR